MGWMIKIIIKEMRGDSHIARSRLIEMVLRDAHELGASKVMLEVRASNSAAQALYKQFGFQIVHRRPRYYVDNREDALLMNLEDLDTWIKSSKQPEPQKNNP